MAQAEAGSAVRDQQAMQVFMKSVEIAGGLKSMAGEHQLDWLTELMESSYVLVLHNDEHKASSEIVAETGMSSGEVDSILGASPEQAIDRFTGQSVPQDHLEREGIAGGVAKLAYQAVHSAS